MHYNWKVMLLAWQGTTHQWRLRKYHHHLSAIITKRESWLMLLNECDADLRPPSRAACSGGQRSEHWAAPARPAPAPSCRCRPNRSARSWARLGSNRTSTGIWRTERRVSYMCPCSTDAVIKAQGYLQQ